MFPLYEITHYSSDDRLSNSPHLRPLLLLSEAALAKGVEEAQAREQGMHSRSYTNVRPSQELQLNASVRYDSSGLACSIRTSPHSGYTGQSSAGVEMSA